MGTTRLRFDLSTEANFVQGDPALDVYDRFKEKFGSDETVLIQVECPDAFAEPHYGRLLALGRALMLDPDILLLDEPSASLSPKMVELIFDRINLINSEGTGILLVEQNAHEALSASNRGYVLAMGENRLEGEAKSLLDNEEVGKLYLGT